MPLIIIHDKSCVRLSMADVVTIVADGYSHLINQAEWLMLLHNITSATT